MTFTLSQFIGHLCMAVAIGFIIGMFVASKIYEKKKEP